MKMVSMDAECVAHTVFSRVRTVISRARDTWLNLRGRIETCLFPRSENRTEATDGYADEGEVRE